MKTNWFERLAIAEIEHEKYVTKNKKQVWLTKSFVSIEYQICNKSF